MEDPWWTMSESVRHLQAKKLVFDMISGNKFHISHETMGRYRTLSVDLTEMRAYLECTYPIIHEEMTGREYFAEHGIYPKMIFDIGLVKDGQVVGCIEVVNSHWIDQVKRAKIIKANIFCIAVCVRQDGVMVDHNHLDAREFIWAGPCAGAFRSLDPLARIS